MDIEQFFKEKETIKLTYDEKEKGREFVLGYIKHGGEIAEEGVEKNVFSQALHRVYNFTRKIMLGTSLYVRTLVATQYGNIEGIWKRKNNDH